jgi:acyl carrier protein
MSSPALSEQPPQLARFPQEIRDAFTRYRTTGDLEDAQIVVSAALLDFLPTSSRRDAAAELADSMRLMEDLGYDSLAIAEIVFFFEDLFAVKIETKDLREIGTVGQLRGFVAGKIGAARVSL